MYSKEQIEKTTTLICDGIAEGKSLRSICRENHGKEFPTLSLVIQWLADADINKSESKFYNFLVQYKHAREVQADTLVDELLDICDDATNDYSVDENGNKVTNQEHFQRSRLRIDTRKWIAGKQRPKKYSDKLDITSHNTHIITELSDEELSQKINILLKSM